MAPVHVLDVERRGIEAFADRHDLGCGNKQEDRGWIDKAPDQPGAGDAIDLRPRSRDPYRSAARVTGGQFRERDGWKFCLLPAHKTTLQTFRGDAAVSQP